MNLREYNETAAEVGVPPCYRGAVITVHGMNTRGRWQKDIAPKFQDALIRCESADFGHVLVGVLCRRKLDRVAEQILEKYEEQLRYHPFPAAIGHSLGSLAIGRTLETKPDIVLKRIIVFGCIIRQDFPWKALAADRRVESVLNESAENDRWARIARYVIPDAGPSGYRGFVDADGVVIERRYKKTGHCGLQHPLHYRKVWIPFLLTGKVAPKRAEV